VIFGGIQKLSLADYPGHTAAVLFTTSCNMRCGYCHNPELVLPERYAEAIPLEEVYDFLAKRQGKLDAIAISGGEPTMHEDLPEFVAALKEAGFLVKLDSNGTHPEMLAQMIAANTIDYIAMDIKGPLHKYSLLAARPIDIDAITRSIKIILDSGLPHEFRTTIVDGQLSLEDFEDIGAMIKGAQRFAAQKFVPSETINPQFMKKSPYTDEEMLQVKQIMEKYVDLCVVH